MSYLDLLNNDLKRQILLYVDDVNLEKVKPLFGKILDDNDVFWKLKAFGHASITNKDIYQLVKFSVISITMSSICATESYIIELFDKLGILENVIRSGLWCGQMVEMRDIPFTEELLKKYINIQDRCGDTLIHYVWNPEPCRELIRLGADVNIKNNRKETAMSRLIRSYALGVATLPCIKLLLDSGAEPYDSATGVCRISYLRDNLSHEELIKHGIFQYLKREEEWRDVESDGRCILRYDLMV